MGSSSAWSRCSTPSSPSLWPTRSSPPGLRGRGPADAGHPGDGGGPVRSASTSSAEKLPVLTGPDTAGKSTLAEDYKAFIEEFLSERDKCVMAGKAKFDQEAALKSIIGAGREMGEEVTEQSMTKSKKQGPGTEVVFSGSGYSIGERRKSYRNDCGKRNLREEI